MDIYGHACPGERERPREAKRAQDRELEEVRESGTSGSNENGSVDWELSRVGCLSVSSSL